MDGDQALLEKFVPFCPKCGVECEAKELTKALDSDKWEKVIVETIYYCPRCDNYWSEGLVEKGYE